MFPLYGKLFFAKPGLSFVEKVKSSEVEKLKSTLCPFHPFNFSTFQLFNRSPSKACAGVGDGVGLGGHEHTRNVAASELASRSHDLSGESSRPGGARTAESRGGRHGKAAGGESAGLSHAESQPAEAAGLHGAVSAAAVSDRAARAEGDRLAVLVARLHGHRAGIRHQARGDRPRRARPQARAQGDLRHHAQPHRPRPRLDDGAPRVLRARRGRQRVLRLRLVRHRQARLPRSGASPRDGRGL